MAESNKNRPNIQLQLDDEVANGQYANMVFVNHNENEFILDFAFLQPGTRKATVLSRIISSPRHTKSLLGVLTKNLSRYEEKFGTINAISKPDSTSIH